MGILLGGAIMVCIAPLFAAGCRGHYCLVTCSAPVALAASGLLAAFFGGWYAVWSGLVPGTVIAVILGGCVSENRTRSPFSSTMTQRPTDCRGRRGKSLMAPNDVQTLKDEAVGTTWYHALPSPPLVKASPPLPPFSTDRLKSADAWCSFLRCVPRCIAKAVPRRVAPETAVKVKVRCDVACSVVHPLLYNSCIQEHRKAWGWLILDYFTYGKQCGCHPPRFFDSTCTTLNHRTIVQAGQQQPTVMVYQGPATTPPQTPIPVVGMGLPGNSAQVKESAVDVDVKLW